MMDSDEDIVFFDDDEEDEGYLFAGQDTCQFVHHTSKLINLVDRRSASSS